MTWCVAHHRRVWWRDGRWVHGNWQPCEAPVKPVPAKGGGKK